MFRIINRVWQLAPSANGARIPGGKRCGHAAYVRRRGMVALEFAMISPVLVTMVLGAWDTARALIVWQETLVASEWIAFTAQTLAVQPDLSTNLTPTYATVAMTTLYGAMPKIRENLYKGVYSVTLSAASFTTAQDGTVTANLLWSVPLTEGNSPPMINNVTRTCGAPIPQVDKWPQNATNLQVVATLAVTLPASIVIADVHYQYTPSFFNFLTGPIDFWESYQLPNLAGSATQLLTYDLANKNDPADCSNQGS
jgi:Flp pilus assembly protein TadG